MNRSPLWIRPPPIQLCAILNKINQEMGVTVICNLHFLSLVRTYADRVIALKNGELIYQGGPDKIDKNWFKQIYGENAVDVTVD